MSSQDQLPASMSDLPTSLMDVAEVFGILAVCKLIEHFGGTEVKFPVRLRPEHPVAIALGADAEAICAHFGGALIYIPHNRTRSLRAEVKRLEKQGLDRTAIARRLRVSQRHVRRLANRQDSTRQLNLF